MQGSKLVAERVRQPTRKYLGILSHGKTAVQLRRRALLLLPQLQRSPMALRARRLQRSLSGVRPREGLDSRKPQSKNLISNMMRTRMGTNALQL